MTEFDEQDVRRLHRRGVSLEEARRQLELLHEPTHHLELVRPCTPGDGIVCLPEESLAELHLRHAEAAAAGRLMKFVPASGAATRMFRSLVRYHDGDRRGESWSAIESLAGEGDADAAELVSFVENLSAFAFHEDLESCLRSRGDDLDARVAARSIAPILDGLLGSSGLHYAGRPKGLLKFHAAADGTRTAFEEHLVEAEQYTRSDDGLCRLHFTVSSEHRRAFEAAERAARPRFQAGGARFEIGYSVQKPSTDTLSLDGRGLPARDGEGRLQFRPGGHGALIENLADLAADVVLVKNIDNVQPDRGKSVTSCWKRALAGYLLELQQEAFEQIGRLRQSGNSERAVDDAREFVVSRLQPDFRHDAELGAEAGALISLLDRPLRVCGVVRNTGEPGGGPFWVRDRQGSISRQIVEASQVDDANPAQSQILHSATHFNPVDLVCGVRDREGRPFDLARFVDPSAVIVTGKSGPAGELRVLERPGLWNGAMAGWNTLFVEVPIETFSPVKTVSDLVRPEHRS